MQHALVGLAENTALPPELIDRLISTADAELAEVLATRPDLTDSQTAALTRFESAAIRLAYEGRLTADNIDPVTQPYAALALLDQQRGKPEWAHQLATNPRGEIREKLAACPALPLDVMQRLASDPDVRVVAELALRTPSTEIATRLAAHPHTDVRRSAAANEATPPSVLASLLTGDGSPESAMFEIRQMALRNPATPTHAATLFGDHPSVLMRVELAARTDMPWHVYARLAQDPEPWVRATLAENPSIAENPSTTENLIRTLAADRGHDVQRRLAHNPAVPLDVLSDLATATKIGPTPLPRIASADPREVEELSTSANPTVRMLLAQRRDLPPQVRDALADDPDAKVVKAIAPHPGLTDAQLRSMVARHGGRVLARVAANPDAGAQLLEELTKHRPPVQKMFREVARHRNATAAALLACLSDRQARRWAARRSALPPETIVDLLGDEDWQVVEAAAGNPSLPHSAMSELVP